MGLFSAKRQPPTATALGSHNGSAQARAPIDQEKGSTAEHDVAVAGGQQHLVDPVIEKRVIRKLDLTLTPLVAGLFLLSFLDRGNIGNAKIAGMAKDLDLTSDRYEWLLTIFYIAYILFQFQGFMWKILPPHIWACFITFAWGVISACQAATTTWGGEMSLRFLLGAVEAGYGPSVPFLLSFFYLRHELGFRIGIFLAAAPLASTASTPFLQDHLPALSGSLHCYFTFAGALAYGITSGQPSLAKWRLLFLVEGIPTILMAGVAFFYLPDNAAKAKFLTAEEREVAVARGVRQTGTVERVGGLDWADIGKTLLDPKPWFTALMYFSCNVSYSSLPVFLPTIIEAMGFTRVNAQGLSAPPYFVACIVTISSAWYADRIQQRGLVIAMLSLLGSLGYTLLAACTSTGARYAGTFLAASGVFPAIANILPWVLNNQGSDTRRGMGIVLLNVVGQCGPLLGTRVFPSRQAPRYVEGQSVCAAFMALNALLALGLRTLLVWENGKLDRKYGVVGQRREGGRTDKGKEEEEVVVVVHANVGEENTGRTFRFVL